MAEKHPYSPSGGGGIAAAIVQLRKAFPAKVTSDTLKKLGIAPNSESYVINVLRFIGVVDAQGAKTKEATVVFSKHNDTEFQQGFGQMVKTAYAELFNLHGDTAWELTIDNLINFFRNNDQTSDLTGRRQAIAFQTLAGLAGHGEATSTLKPKQTKEPKPKSAKPKQVKPQASPAGEENNKGLSGTNYNHEQHDVGLTVRIEVNLPAAGEQETYDRIFRSIRENLLNAK